MLRRSLDVAIEVPRSQSSLGTEFASRLTMAIVLISWVSISTMFCLALVRAAVRRHFNAGAPVETVLSAPRPKVIVAAPAAFQQSSAC